MVKVSFTRAITVRVVFLSIVDTVIMGKNTYKKIMDKEGADNWPYKDMTTLCHHPFAG